MLRGKYTMGELEKRAPSTVEEKVPSTGAPELASEQAVSAANTTA